MIRNLIKKSVDKLNKYQMKKCGIDFDDSMRTVGVIRLKIATDSKVEIGNHTVINSSWRENPTAGEKTLFCVCGGANLKIGNYAGISNSTVIVHNKVVIEDCVNIGAGCKIYDTDSHSIEFGKRMEEQDIGKNAPVIIKYGAWVGGSCIILKGVTIGEKSVIGAGSVVTKDVPANELWAGNPAVFVKKIV